MRLFLKYVGIFVGIQLFVCIGLWFSAIAFSSDVLFGIMLYIYWPVILALAALSGGHGESAMIAVPIFGSALGILIYSIVGGLLMSYLKSKGKRCCETL